MGRSQKEANHSGSGSAAVLAGELLSVAHFSHAEMEMARPASLFMLLHEFGAKAL